MTAPLSRTLEATVDNVAATSDEYTMIGRAPYAATVSEVVFIPRDSVTGLTVATAARVLTVYNRGATAGTGTVAVATRTIASGTNLVDGVPLTLTLATAASLSLVSGAVLELESLHITTGVLDPGGKVIVTLARA